MEHEKYIKDYLKEVVDITNAKRRVKFFMIVILKMIEFLEKNSNIIFKITILDII